MTKHAAATQGNSVRLVIEDDGTFLGEYVHGGQISDDSFYRVWVRDQEYSEGELMSGLPARDDGYARKAGFRFDKELAIDLDLTIAGGFATRRVEHVLDLSYRLFYINNDPPNGSGLTPGIQSYQLVSSAPTWLAGTNFHRRRRRWAPIQQSGGSSDVIKITRICLRTRLIFGRSWKA